MQREHRDSVGRRGSGVSAMCHLHAVCNSLSLYAITDKVVQHPAGQDPLTVRTLLAAEASRVKGPPPFHNKSRRLITHREENPPARDKRHSLYKIAQMLATARSRC